MVTNGRTSNEKFIAIDFSNTINRLSGGVVIAPWEIERLGLDWINTFLVLKNDLPTMKAAIEVQKSIVDKWKKNHPTYRGI